MKPLCLYSPRKKLVRKVIMRYEKMYCMRLIEYLADLCNTLPSKYEETIREIQSRDLTPSHEKSSAQRFGLSHSRLHARGAKSWEFPRCELWRWHIQITFPGNFKRIEIDIDIESGILTWESQTVDGTEMLVCRYVRWLACRGSVQAPVDQFILEERGFFLAINFCMPHHALLPVLRLSG